MSYVGLDVFSGCVRGHGVSRLTRRLSGQSKRINDRLMTPRVATKILSAACPKAAYLGEYAPWRVFLISSRKIFRLNELRDFDMGIPRKILIPEILLVKSWNIRT